jgi:hypothetical protein
MLKVHRPVEHKDIPASSLRGLSVRSYTQALEILNRKLQFLKFVTLKEGIWEDY